MLNDSALLRLLAWVPRGLGAMEVYYYNCLVAPVLRSII